jgi:AcrR family transcriptional regulator
MHPIGTFNLLNEQQVRSLQLGITRVTLAPVAPRARPAKRAPARKQEPRKTQAERAAISNTRLLEAAVKVIAGKGYRAASLQAIGEMAGYSRGLVSHRFGSKEGLLKVLLANVPDAWEDKVGDAVGLDAIKIALRLHRAMLVRIPDHVRALFMVMYEAQGELTELAEGFAERDRHHRTRFEKVLRDGQRAGNVRADLDLTGTANMLLALLRGVIVVWLNDPAQIDLDRTYAEMERMLERALAP